jgi:hypothetical protein
MTTDLVLLRYVAFAEARRGFPCSIDQLAGVVAAACATLALATER